MRKILLTLLSTLFCSVTAWGATYTWDFSSNTKTTYTNGASYSLLATDGVTEMRYTAGSSDGLESTYLKENGKTGGASCKDVDGTTVISKNRLIRLFVTGTGTLTISCTSNIGVYKIYQSNAAGTAASGSQIGSNYTGNGTAFGTSITVSGACIWIETATKGYITSITWTTGSSCSAPTSPSISGTAAYTAGNDISLTASATGTSGTTTYTWYKGANWATASASSPVQATSTSGATFTKASCSMSDAGTYWCNISNGTGCDVQASQAITVSCKNPTQTFSNSDYTIGGAALNLSTKFSSNSSGAVTYSVQNAGGTGASIAGTSFSATTEGTATVRASQDANGDYCAKTIDASVSVAAADCTDPGLTITLN